MTLWGEDAREERITLLYGRCDCGYCRRERRKAAVGLAGMWIARGLVLAGALFLVWLWLVIAICALSP